jgi:hypothetical protein
LVFLKSPRAIHARNQLGAHILRALLAVRAKVAKSNEGVRSTSFEPWRRINGDSFGSWISQQSEPSPLLNSHIERIKIDGTRDLSEVWNSD